MRTQSQPTTVLASSPGPCQEQTHLLTLWHRVEELGWFPEGSFRIIIQIGQVYRGTLVVDTTRSLAHTLRKRFPNTEIQVIDPASRAEDWKPFPLVDDAADSLTIFAVAAPRRLRVPKLWFEPYFLVTVAAPGPSSYGGVSGILDAQAEPLRRVATGFCPPDALMFEAHRLASSDLCILCGNKIRTNPSSSPWWLVSQSDVAIEQAMGAAAGVAGTNLPSVRAVARHEILLPTPAMEGILHELRGYMTPALLIHLYTLQWRIGGFLQAVMDDASVVRGNLHKIPRFVRRRVARARTKRRAA